MITCGPNHPLITRGCVVLAVLVIIGLAIYGVFFGISNANANADTPCTPVAYVAGLATPYANVRQTPAITSGQVARIFPGDTPAPADSGTKLDGFTWWHVCSKGYVRNDVVKVITLTPRATPTRLSQAQTNIAQMTATARAATNQPRIVVIEGENGVAEVHITCPVPCEIKWIVEQLP